MRNRRNTNLYSHRLFAWLIVSALLVLTLPSGASWQCLNGTPCPQNCPILQQEVAAKPTCTPAAGGHCAKCRAAFDVSRVTEAVGICPASQCVLRVKIKPDVLLTDRAAFAFALFALPPPPPTVVVAPLTETASVSYPQPLVFFPQRFLWPHFGRAPPVLL